MARSEFAIYGWPETLERLSDALLLLLVLCLPFEMRAVSSAPTQLQFLFLAMMAASAPALLRDRHDLLGNRVVVAALIFAGVQWVAAYASGDFALNAVKAALRYTAGVALMCLVIRSTNRKQLLDAWAIAAIAAAFYALVDYCGYGFPKMFREIEFYFEDVRRLSGSFEYPNVAAAYFAVSLPIVWSAPSKTVYKTIGCALIWTALILTFSRGAIVAVILIACIWALVRRSYQPLLLLAIPSILLVPLVYAQPLLIERVVRFEPRSARNAEYRLTYNRVREPAAMTTSLPVTVRNTGRETWSSEGEKKVTVSYHWYDPGNKMMVEIPAIETSLPHDVVPNETVNLSAKFQTPDVDGFYILVWDLRSAKSNWFSTEGVLPGVAEAEVRSGAASWRGNGDVSRWLRPAGSAGPTAAADVPRKQLWRAALTLARAHPVLGVGPDNYRLMYGKILGFAKWDTNIHSNSLYLETLVGSGIIGFAALMHLLLRIPWRCTPALLAVAVFLIHGFSEFFLMTTPIYFAFWTLVGSAVAEAHENRI